MPSLAGNKAAEGQTLGDLLRRYEARGTRTKRSSRAESSRIKMLLAHLMAQVAVTRVTLAFHIVDNLRHKVTGMREAIATARLTAPISTRSSKSSPS